MKITTNHCFTRLVLSRGLQGQNYFHNYIKILFLFFFSLFHECIGAFTRGDMMCDIATDWMWKQMRSHLSSLNRTVKMSAENKIQCHVSHSVFWHFGKLTFFMKMFFMLTHVFSEYFITFYFKYNINMCNPHKQKILRPKSLRTALSSRHPVPYEHYCW